MPVRCAPAPRAPRARGLRPPRGARAGQSSRGVSNPTKATAGLKFLAAASYAMSTLLGSTPSVSSSWRQRAGSSSKMYVIGCTSTPLPPTCGARGAGAGAGAGWAAAAGWRLARGGGTLWGCSCQRPGRQRSGHQRPEAKTAPPHAHRATKGSPHMKRSSIDWEQPPVHEEQSPLHLADLLDCGRRAHN